MMMNSWISCTQRHCRYSVVALSFSPSCVVFVDVHEWETFNFIPTRSFPTRHNAYRGNTSEPRYFHCENESTSDSANKQVTNKIADMLLV